MSEYDRYSRKVSEFTEFLREIQEIYTEHKPLEHQADVQTQDILHTLELDPVKYRDCALLAIKLKEIRQERREAKDTVRHTQPIIDWIVANQKAVNTLSNLFGELKKLEKEDRQRQYEHRTDVAEAIVKDMPGRMTLPASKRVNAESISPAPVKMPDPTPAPIKKPNQQPQTQAVKQKTKGQDQPTQQKQKTNTQPKRKSKKT